jgi:hypothetical protein
MATGPALIVATAGNGAWLSYLLAMVAVVLIGLYVAQFGASLAARRRTSPKPDAAPAATTSGHRGTPTRCFHSFEV